MVDLTLFQYSDILFGLLFVLFWFVVITAIPGLSVLTFLYKDLKRYGIIELSILAIGIGISYLVILGYFLDEFLIFNLITVILFLLLFPCLVILRYHKDIFHLFKTLRNQLKEDVLRTILLDKIKSIKISASTVILLLVICFIIFIELNDLTKSIVMPVSDTWFWLLESKKIAINGHLTTEPGSIAYIYFLRFPRGAAYLLASLFLPNLINPYYIILFIGPFLSLLQCLGVYIASKKIIGSDKFAIYAVLVYGTSRLIIWRGKIYTTESLGLFLIITLALILFEKNQEADFLGLLILSGLGLTSFGSFGPIILPTLLYIVLFKSHKTKIVTIGVIIGGSLLLPVFRQSLWILIRDANLNANVFTLATFINNAQWTFGYSLAFSFIGVIYYFLNRSSERMFYVMCFLELFILINFIELLYVWMNVRIFPFFSIFASTLTAQGLQSTLKGFRSILTSLREKGNVKSFIIHFIIVICIVYQVFFGMVRGYHATIARRYNSEDIAAALWIYDNAPETATILVLAQDSGPYSSILYPRKLIHDNEIYNYSPESLVSYCTQNNISYIVLEIDAFLQSIKVNDHFKEVYSNVKILIIEFNP